MRAARHNILTKSKQMIRMQQMLHGDHVLDCVNVNHFEDPASLYVQSAQ